MANNMATTGGGDDDFIPSDIHYKIRQLERLFPKDKLQVLTFWGASFTRAASRFLVDFLEMHPQGVVGTVEFIQCKFVDLESVEILRAHFLKQTKNNITVLVQIARREFVFGPYFRSLIDFAHCLHFGECPLRDDGFAYLVDVIVEGNAKHRIQVLDVQRTNLSGKSLPHVTRLLQHCQQQHHDKNQNFHTLVLYWNRGLFNGADNTRQEETKRLCQVLSKNTTLETLDLDDIAVGPKTAALLFETFTTLPSEGGHSHSNTTLKSLYFDQENAQLDMANRKELIRFLPNMRNLVELVFPLIHETDDGDIIIPEGEEQEEDGDDDIIATTNRNIVASLSRNPNIEIVRARYETPRRFMHAQFSHYLARNTKLNKVLHLLHQPNNNSKSSSPSSSSSREAASIVPVGLWRHLLMYTCQENAHDATAVYEILRHATIDEATAMHSSLLVLEGLAAARQDWPRLDEKNQVRLQRRQKHRQQRRRQREKLRFGWAKS